jgi:acetolactate synthase-1/2/3 large subunit
MTDFASPAAAHMPARSGGRILVEALAAQGVDRIFCVPGESYLPVLDTLRDFCSIDVVVARHEGAAANMAEADGKLTQRPGICFATRGPGATHASIGVHTAKQDSTPMILFVGQIDSRNRDREGFQEIDYRAMFGAVAKWVVEIDNAERIGETISRAFHIAISGRPGPVVIALPENVLEKIVEAPPPPAAAIAPKSAPRGIDVEAIAAALKRAERPLIIAGGSGWSVLGCAALRSLAERLNIPVVASFRRQDLLDNRSPAYAGHAGLGMDPKLAARIRDADLILSIGSRLSENTTGGYGLIAIPSPVPMLIHVHPDPSELGRVYRPALATCSDLSEFTCALDAMTATETRHPTPWSTAARADFEMFVDPARVARSKAGVDMTKVVAWLSDTLGDDAMVSNGAGNYTVWLHRFYTYRKPRTELAPTSGAMGYGFPAAIAAKLRHPERDVVAFAGDGCFLMYPQELATAIQHDVPLIVLVVNNGMYGTIRMHQERRYPGRVMATDLVNPDFAALATSFGAYAETVTRTEDFAPAFERARAAGRVALLELQVDPQQITPAMRLD